MLNRECIVFCKYLIGQKPNKYVVSKYSEAHKLGKVNRDTDIKYFDDFLVWLATTSPLLTNLVDAYTCKLHKRSLIRRKLILLIAMLESTAPSCYSFDLVSVRNKADFVVNMCWKVFLYVISFLLSVIALMPLHLLFKSLEHSDKNIHG